MVDDTCWCYCVPVCVPTAEGCGPAVTSTAHSAQHTRSQVLQRLGQYLPEEHRSVAELRQLARSAQFQQQLATFSGALQTGQLDLGQFGLRAEVRLRAWCFLLSNC